MPMDLLYPTNTELTEIDAVFMANLTLDDEIFNIFPLRATSYAQVMWEQNDNYFGLQQIRGYNGEPQRVPNVGRRRYAKQPGVYGEYDLIDEQELTIRAQPGTHDQVVDVSDLVINRDEQLLVRQVTRIRWILWNLLSRGLYTVTGPDGTIMDQDAYTPQLFTAGVTWATVATATPLANFRAIKLLARGQGVIFDGGAVAFMNQTTANNYLANQNANDLGGRRISGGNTVNSMAGISEIHQGDGLPRIVIEDGGYLDDNGVFQLWCPDNRVIVVGRRQNGARLGEFLLTRNASNPDFSSSTYAMVIDSGRNPYAPPPRKVEVHRGMNGGPTLQFPTAIVIMTV
jgi:hypothetical protein